MYFRLIINWLFTQQQEGEGVPRGRQVKAALLVKLKHGALGGGHLPGRGAIGALPGGAAQDIILLKSTNKNKLGGENIFSTWNWSAKNTLFVNKVDS